jgi:hypothetical protein
MNTNYQHTPGKWTYKTIEPPYGNVRTFEIWSDCYSNLPANMLAVVSGRGYIDNGRVEANARLIAAAPELLAALEDLYESFEHDGSEKIKTDIILKCPEVKAALNIARAALQKATA